MISEPVESAVVRLAQAATLTFRGLPISPVAWILVEPLNEKPLFRTAATHDVVPVTVPVRPLPDESEAEVPLVSLSFHQASCLPSSKAVHCTIRNSKVWALAVRV